MEDPHHEDRLSDYVLGLLTGGERAHLAEHLEGCERCRAAARELEAAVSLAAVALGPPGEGGQRLLAALEGARRFEHLLAEVAALFDLSSDAARALLAKVDQPDAWQEGPAPGCQVMPVEAGPSCRGQVVSLLRLEPGATFPEHTHGNEERVLVLEGGYLDSTGLECWRGELDVRPKGSFHHFSALPGPPCLCAAVTAFPDDA